jgi:tetratricopeptide (TPR) repeat protein
MLGTPAYMSPEQFRGDEADARSDQFGFCATLWEGLYGQRPFQGADVRELRTHVLAGKLVAPPEGTKVPTWLRAILERGLSLAADNRWPSMQALLAALEYDPGRIRRRWAIGGLAGLAIAAAGLAGAAYRGAEARACDGAADALAGVWDEPQRTALDAAVRATSVDYAETTLAAARGHLDGYRDGLIAAQTSACEAHRRGSVSDSLFDRRMLCLRQRRAELAATVTVLQQTTAETVAQVASTATGLPPLAACEDDERLINDRSLPTDPAVAAAVEKAREGLARVQALGRSQRYQEALAELAPLQREAEALGDLTLPRRGAAPPRLAHGRHAAPRSRPSSRSSRPRSSRSSPEPTPSRRKAITAWISNVGYGASRPAEAIAAGPRAWALVRRVGSPPDLVAELHNNLAAALYEAGDAAGGSAEYEQALALISAHAPDDPLRWALTHNLATALVQFDQHERADALAREALARLTALHDPCHPHASVLRMLLAGLDRARGSSATAVSDLEQALACLGDDYPGFTAKALAELAETHRLAGDRPRATATLNRADELIRRSPEIAAVGLEVDLVRADLHMDAGELAAARQVLEAGYPRAAQAYGADHYQITTIWTRLAALALRGGDLDRAQQHLDTATRLTRPVLPAAERGLYAATAARLLRARGGPADEVAARVAEATRAYEAAGAAYAPRIFELRDGL